MTTEEWAVAYFVEDNGRVPVQEFLAGLDAKTYVRFQWSLEQLRVRNIQAKYPLVRPVEGKIWELREESMTNIYRILYCFAPGRHILLLHGFVKKSQRLPRNELTIAQRRLAHYETREAEGGHTP